MTTQPQLLEIRAGRARDFARPDWDHNPERIWRSAYEKSPLSGAVQLRTLGIEADEQYDKDAHGGPHMALLAYAAGHYPSWRVELALPAIGPGGFGENLVVHGLDERSVAIGDVWSVGEALVQVSQPRGPCAHISRRWDREDLLKRVTANAHTGWYLRVLEEGAAEAGQPITVIERPNPEWTVERVFRARIAKATLGAEDRAVLAGMQAMTPEWREMFE